MTERVYEPDEDDVPELAVRALNAATQRAIAAGHVMVFVRDGQLIRQLPTGEVEVLKQMPPWRKVTQAMKAGEPEGRRDERQA